MPECELADFLRPGGPRQVPLRTCCVVALLTRGPSMPGDGDGDEAVEARWPYCALVPTPEPVP